MKLQKQILTIYQLFQYLETIEKRIQALSRVVKSGDKEAVKQMSLAERIKPYLEQGKNVRGMDFDELEWELVREFQLITSKPVLYLCNVDEASVKTGNEFVERVKENVKDEDAEVLMIGAKIEADITELDTFEERKMFLDELGLDEPGVNRLIRSAYTLLNLQTYFTAGVKEVRAWTIHVGDTAPQAAGVNRGLAGPAGVANTTM